MNKKGNAYGLLKAIKANSTMSNRQKQKAVAGVRRRYGLGKQRRNPAHSRHGQGFEGFKEASFATAKLVSAPVHQAVEGYHVVNGIRKMWKAAEKWLDKNL
jgi:hypothetical protein